jgi:hypothetical protein
MTPQAELTVNILQAKKRRPTLYTREAVAFLLYNDWLTQQ